MTAAEMELARIVAIIGASEAAGRERLAVHLALNTRFTLEGALECLRISAADHPSPAVVAAMEEAEAVAVLH